MDHLTIENRTGKVKLDGTIHEGTMEALIDRMATLYGDDAVRNEIKIGDAVAVASDALESLEIEINSPGGSIKQGYRAYKTIIELRERGVHVTARITKLAASMGSILAVAADKVLIESKAKMMIHDAATMTWGNAEEMKQAADLLDSISNELAAIYANRTGKSVSEMRDLMKKETWLDADAAVKAGLADEVYTKDPTAEKPKDRLDRLLDGDESNTKFDTTTKAMSILSKLFPGNDQIAQLEAQVAENETLRAELVQAQSKITELSGLSQVIAQKDSELSELTAKLTTAEATITTNQVAIADLTEKAAVTPEIVSLQAAELLAATGHPSALDLSGDTETAVNHFEQYNSLQGAEKTAYYEKHSKEIRSHITK
jgi:ATP-dependent protease ClpP protease subunit